LKKDKEGWCEMSAEDKKELLPNAKKSQIELIFPDVKNRDSKLERDLYPFQLIVMEIDKKLIQERENPKKKPAHFVDAVHLALKIHTQCLSLF
jgi:hypothetical protein